MDILRRVVSNTLISLVGQAITWTSTLLLTVAYGRFLGDVKFGELYLALTFVQLVGFPVEFGVNQQVIREVAAESGLTQRYYASSTLIKGVAWVLVYFILLLLCQLLGYSPEQRVLIYVCGISLLMRSLSNTVTSLHFAEQHAIFPVIGNILEKVFSAALSIILLFHGAGVITMAFVLLESVVISGIWNAIWYYRFFSTRFPVDLQLIRDTLRTGLPFLAYGVINIIYYRIDTVLLSLLTTVAVVGWYGAAYRLFDTLTFLPSLVISAIMFPVFSRLTVSSEENLKLAIEKSLNFLLFLSLPISVGLIVAAPSIIGFLYHNADFGPAVLALQGLAPGLVFLYANSVFNAVLISTKNEKKITIMAAVALVFNLGLNLILIPVYQQLGAAILTSLTELLLCVMSIFFLPRHLLPVKSLAVIGKSLFASFVMALAIVNLVIYNFTNLLIILPVAMLFYFGTATLMGAIPRSDMEALFRSVRARSRPSAA